jgi:hypothetical protein
MRSALGMAAASGARSCGLALVSFESMEDVLLTLNDSGCLSEQYQNALNAAKDLAERLGKEGHVNLLQYLHKHAIDGLADIEKKEVAQ